MMTNYPWAFHNPSPGRVVTHVNEVISGPDPAAVRAEVKKLKEQQSDSVKATVVTGDVVAQDPVPQTPQNAQVKTVAKRKVRTVATPLKTVSIPKPTSMPKPMPVDDDEED